MRSLCSARDTWGLEKRRTCASMSIDMSGDLLQQVQRSCHRSRVVEALLLFLHAAHSGRPRVYQSPGARGHALAPWPGRPVHDLRQLQGLAAIMTPQAPPAIEPGHDIGHIAAPTAKA